MKMKLQNVLTFKFLEVRKHDFNKLCLERVSLIVIVGVYVRCIQVS